MPQTLKETFYTKLEEKLTGRNMNNSSYLHREKYNRIVSEVQEAKFPNTTATKLSSKTRLKRLRRFDVCGARLLDKRSNSRLFYVAVEELFDIIHTTHTLGHLGRNRMIYELKKNYKNVTYEAVNIYLKLCRTCEEKKANIHKHTVVKPIVESTFNDRCQVDLIDMQSCPDGEWHFIFVYQDHLTKFVQLKALKTKQTEEVAAALADVFNTFGAPCILQSDNGREFVSSVIEELVRQWPHARLVHGAPRHSQSQGSVERANRDIKQMLAAWMNDEKKKNEEPRWSVGLAMVQFSYNAAFHSSIGQSPYECLFGVPPKKGLTTLVKMHNYNDIRTEEQLATLADTVQRTSSCSSTTNTVILESSDLMDTSTATTTTTTASNNNDNEDDDDYDDNTLHARRTRDILARECLQRQAYVMLSRTYAVHARSFPSVNDTVRVFVPSVDRGPMDAHNLLACVIEVRPNLATNMSSSTTTSLPQIRVGTSHGVLNHWLSSNQFERVEHSMVPPDSVNRSKTITLRQAVAANSMFGGQGMVRCHCRLQCTSKKCSCRKAGVLCTQRCHRTGSCSNYNR